MLIACWSVKGGVGTTVTAAGMAVAIARCPGQSCLLVDLAGDAPWCLGVAEPAGAGLAEWLAAGCATPPDALARLEVSVAPGLALLPRGSGPLLPDRGALLVQMLASIPQTVVVDCGQLVSPGVAQRVAAEADRSLLVSRLCSLGLRYAARSPVRPSGVILIREPGRILSVEDVEQAVGAPVVATVAVDPGVARLVDVGLLAGRIPRSFTGVLRSVAP